MTKLHKDGSSGARDAAGNVLYGAKPMQTRQKPTPPPADASASGDAAPAADTATARTKKDAQK